MDRRRAATTARLKQVGLLAVCAVAAFALAAPAASRAPAPKRPFAERLAHLAGIENVARIAPGIYRGDQPSRDGLRTLKSMGVRTVINLRHYHGKGEERACRELGLDYVPIALASTDEPSDESTRRFLAIVTDPKRQPVYFHCRRGKDRTGTMCAVYRVVIEGWSAEDALAEMAAFGAFKGYRDLRHYVERIAAQPTRVWPLPESP